ncbi:hypothetical protein [Luteolibacter marinus]|uniref:hypothetical protein n=1 Tax=Luteolibacter marinus TaxID=2776705 RepID=UPI001865B07C|nr:hypothetical protein [Luteolibacter marinus]
MKSKSGKALLRKRGEYLELGFCHVLDHGGSRRATLRGRENLTKRQVGAALAFSLSPLMRHHTGHGTPKQWLAAIHDPAFGLVSRLSRWFGRLTAATRAEDTLFRQPVPSRRHVAMDWPAKPVARFSTGC